MATDDNTYDDLESIYRIMDLVYFVVMLSLLVYVIGFKLRFSIDRAGYVILIT